MVAKVFLAIGLVIGIALIIQAYVDASREAETLKQETSKWAENIAKLFIGSVEHAMREGQGIKVKQNIDDLRDTVQKAAQVRIYDQRGIEVFGTRETPPPRSELPPPVAAILDDPVRRVGDDGRVYRPVRNEKRCQNPNCHDASNPLRGVIELDLVPNKLSGMREEIFSRVVTAGFIHIMSAQREDKLDAYFAEIARDATSIDKVAVFDADGDLTYGTTIPALAPEAVTALLVPGAQAKYSAIADHTLALVPLPMQDRCVSCHEEEEIGSIRGVLALTLGGKNSASAGSGADVAVRELEGAIDTSLRFIMLSELGRRIADFLDEVASTAAVRELVLYDNEGRRYWTTKHPEPPDDVAEVLKSGETYYNYLGSGMQESLLAVAPLRNSLECMRCHGSDSSLRGVVSVQVSTEIAEMTRENSITRRFWFTAATLLAILLMLGGLLQYLVARPVQRIGEVADKIGGGNLKVTVEHADSEGDEIARLGQRVNEMVRGLRTKMHLEKFVSKGAAKAAASAGLAPLERQGERRAVTVLFSDIRGFTAYSEKVAPETVVEMLNRLLRAQAEVVVDHGGDIDKYVGDELMAVFAGDDAEARAARCAVAMVDAVESARKEGESLDIGVGISTGDVVYGSIGHEDRMDFTVIGDVVNTGARLCSAATRHEILVSTAVYDAVGDVAGCRFIAGEPLELKGKKDPFPVFKVERRDEESAT